MTETRGTVLQCVIVGSIFLFVIAVGVHAELEQPSLASVLDAEDTILTRFQSLRRQNIDEQERKRLIRELKHDLNKLGLSISQTTFRIPFISMRVVLNT